VERLRARHILVNAIDFGRVRFVTHYDVTAADIDTVLGTVSEFFRS
jgi:threonine aldolase